MNIRVVYLKKIEQARKSWMLILFLVFPIASLLIALNNYHLQRVRKYVYLFLIYFGLTVVLNNPELDSYIYGLSLEEYGEKSSSEFFLELTDLYGNKELMDLIRPLINFGVSRISIGHSLLFGVFAAVFGFFYLKSVNAVYDEYSKIRNINSYFFFLFFVWAINPIFNINGFRFWTATWVFFWGAYKFILYNNNKGLLVAFSAILFHFSFIFPVLLLVSYIVLGNRNRLYAVLLFFSFFISELAWNIFPSLKNLLGSGFDSKISGYTSDARIERVENQQNYAVENNLWYMILPGIINFYYFITVTLVLYWRNNFQYNEKIQRSFSFTLLMAAGVNLVSFIPSMGRFKALFYLFAAVTIIEIINQISPKRIKWYTYIGVLPFLLQVSLNLRLGMDLLNPWLFSFFPLPFIFDDLSLYQALFE